MYPTMENVGARLMTSRVCSSDIDDLLRDIEDRADKAFLDRDRDGIERNYHPNAVLIHLGHKATFGAKAIADEFSRFFTLDYTHEDVKNERLESFGTPDFSYLFRKSRYRIGASPWFYYMQIFERQPDGQYKIIHDQYEWK